MGNGATSVSYSTVTVGTGAPTAGIGNDGDYFLDYNPPGIFYLKNSGTWNSLGCFLYPQSQFTSISTVLIGDGAPSSAGANGNYYLDRHNYVLYVYNDGKWICVSFILYDIQSACIRMGANLQFTGLADKFRGLYSNASASLALNNSGNVSANINSLAEQFYIKYISPLIRAAGEVAIVRSIEKGKSEIAALDEKFDGRVAPAARSLLNVLVGINAIVSHGQEMDFFNACLSG
jgi:hypothetical protein